MIFYLDPCCVLQVVTVGKFQGGGAFNVIPDSVTIGGTFRAFLKESFNQLKQRIEEVRAFVWELCVTLSVVNSFFFRDQVLLDENKGFKIAFNIWLLEVAVKIISHCT
jgi:hypothetical protein